MNLKEASSVIQTKQKNNGNALLKKRTQALLRNITMEGIEYMPKYIAHGLVLSGKKLLNTVEVQAETEEALNKAMELAEEQNHFVVPPNSTEQVMATISWDIERLDDNA